VLLMQGNAQVQVDTSVTIEVGSALVLQGLSSFTCARTCLSFDLDRTSVIAAESVSVLAVSSGQTNIAGALRFSVYSTLELIGNVMFSQNVNLPNTPAIANATFSDSSATFENGYIGNNITLLGSSIVTVYGVLQSFYPSTPVFNVSVSERSTFSLKRMSTGLIGSISNNGTFSISSSTVSLGQYHHSSGSLSLAGKTKLSIQHSVLRKMSFELYGEYGEDTYVTLIAQKMVLNFTGNVTIPGEIYVGSSLHVQDSLSIIGGINATQANISVIGSLRAGASINLTSTNLTLFHGTVIQTPRIEIRNGSTVATAGSPSGVVGDVVNGGILLVNPNCSISIIGNYTQLPQGTFTLDKLDPKNRTNIPMVVNGSVFLDGQIQYSIEGELSKSSYTFLVITSDQGITGFYYNKPSDWITGTRATATYDNQDVYLKIVQIDLKILGLEWYMWLIGFGYLLLLVAFLGGVGCNKLKEYEEIPPFEPKNNPM